jgi:hypothetical protein
MMAVQNSWLVSLPNLMAQNWIIRQGFFLKNQKRKVDPFKQLIKCPEVHNLNVSYQTILNQYAWVRGKGNEVNLRNGQMMIMISDVCQRMVQILMKGVWLIFYWTPGNVGLTNHSVRIDRFQFFFHPMTFYLLVLFSS